MKKARKSFLFLLVPILIIGIFWHVFCKNVLFRNVLAQGTITNSSFEEDWAGWSHGGTISSSIATTQKKTGAKSVLVGDVSYRCDGGIPIGVGFIKQTVQIPNNAKNLTFWYRVFTQERTNDSDQHKFSVWFGDTKLLEVETGKEISGDGCGPAPADSGWREKALNIEPYKGQNLELKFQLATTNPYYNSYIYIDDVEVLSTTPPTPVCQNQYFGSDVNNKTVNLNSGGSVANTIVLAPGTTAKQFYWVVYNLDNRTNPSDPNSVPQPVCVSGAGNTGENSECPANSHPLIFTEGGTSAAPVNSKTHTLTFDELTVTDTKTNKLLFHAQINTSFSVKGDGSDWPGFVPQCVNSVNICPPMEISCGPGSHSCPRPNGCGLTCCSDPTPTLTPIPYDTLWADFLKNYTMESIFQSESADYDYNLDHKIDAVDASILLQRWRNTIPTHTPPLPSHTPPP